MINESQIVRLMTVTVNDILKEVGDLVTFKLDAVELKNKVVHVKFSIADSTLPQRCKSSNSMKLRVVDLEKWINEPLEFIEKISSKIADALAKKGK